MSSSLTERDEGRGGGGAGAVDGADDDVTDLAAALPAGEANEKTATAGDTPDADEEDDDARTIRGDEAEGGEAVASQEATPPAVTVESPMGGIDGIDEIDEIDGSTLGGRYRELLADQPDTASEDGSALGLPRRPGSPSGSVLSVPESTTSTAQQSGISSVGGSSTLSGLLRGASPSFRPFDRRFQSRIASPSGLLSPRSSSPALFGAHSRNASTSSQFHLLETGGSGTESPSPPWEVVRWTKLVKLSNQAFSESAKRNFGAPTCMAISTSIVLGTTKGILLLFDYNQNLKMILGPGTRAVEAGAITAVAVSADHTTVAGGHADGSIFTWEISRAARPFLHIPALEGPRTTDGHLHGFAVTHLGFLGTRRTALVSADDRGMAFAHLATRGTGSLGRTVKTNRILGRYPGSKAPASGKAVKPSTVLAFAPLPLGNVDRATDVMGLTAMLTPYLLVIVSTTPVANTQHKSPRPKEVAPHSAMSGCLAWFPAVRLKLPDPRTGETVSKAKLVYCWSNVLTVLDVEEEAAEDRDKPPNLHCRARSRWKCEEAIVAVQWLTRSVLAVLTVSQRLIVLEDHSMRVTEAFDLINRFIYHADLFSRQLQGVVETLDETDPSLHGVVADAFYMSFKAYKGRLFLLGFSDMAIGALSNWADRLIALMEHGDYVGAIELATVFYTGAADKLTIGLPEDTATRHAMVRERLMEIMAASLRYVFGQRQKQQQKRQKLLALQRRASSVLALEADPEDDAHLQQLAAACFAACQSVGDDDFVFDDMFEWFEEGGVEGLFLETLEPYILDGAVRAVPPTVVKAMVRHFVARGLEGRLEEMLCHMDTATLDLDQVTGLCKQHGLYDALIYVWNAALQDFVTPLVELLRLLVGGQAAGGEGENGEDGNGPTSGETNHESSAVKMFPYLSYVLTGRAYPTGETMDEERQQLAKSELYWFLFSGKSVAWPRGSRSGAVFRTRPEAAQEPSFPYLRLILQFDAPSLLSALNEAFEDPFLNDWPEKQLVQGSGSNGQTLSEEQAFGRTVNRQYIVTILTEVMVGSGEFAAADTIYLDMFIARNLPKYPQYLVLPESTLTRVLTGLCGYPGLDLEEDAQLSAEYLLSVYHPAEMERLLPQFRAAGFFRILKRTYRADRQYGKLLQTYFADPEDREGVFACISECLGGRDGENTNDSHGSGSTALAKRQDQEVRSVVREHLRALVELDAAETARRLGEHAPEMHAAALAAVEDRQDLQYAYLGALLEGEGHGRQHYSQRHKFHEHDNHDERRQLMEQYVRLMCTFAPAHVSDYVGVVQATDLRLDALLPTMEETGVVDAAVVLMAREGQVREAMERLVRHLHTLEAAVEGVIAPVEGGGEGGGKEDGGEAEAGEEAEHADVDDASDTRTVIQRDAAEDLMRALQKYTHVGIWLCQSQGKTGATAAALARKTDDLSADEQLWLELIDTTVQITRRLSGQLQAVRVGDDEADKLLGLVRSLVQHTFTALLKSTTGATVTTTTTTTAAAAAVAAGGNVSFLRVLKAFLGRAAATSPSLADLRAVLASIFTAYAYEETILRLSNRLLDRSLFVSVERSVVLRQRGWRAKGSTCGVCGRRVWGPGVQAQGPAGKGIYEAWEARQAAEAAARSARKAARRAAVLGSTAGGGETRPADDGDKGKGKQPEDGRMREAREEREEREAREARQEREAREEREEREEQEQGPTAADEAADGAADTKSAVGPLVLFACRHVYHQACLDALAAAGGRPADAYRCPVDG